MAIDVASRVQRELELRVHPAAVASERSASTRRIALYFTVANEKIVVETIVAPPEDALSPRNPLP